MCAACHVADWTPAATNVVVPSWAPAGMVPPVFTDFTFDNLGVPKSEHKLLVDAPVDLGLGPIVGNTDENGKFKVMTLRNIGLTKPYAHNGFFKNLKDITHFYNTRDVKPECPGPYTEAEALAADCWPPPEVSENVNTDELGDLGLTPDEEAAIVAFLKTLSDGYMP